MSDLYCKKSVHNPGGWTFHQCRRKAWKDGYCKQHHPDSAEARRKKLDEKFDIQNRIRDLSCEISDLRYECIDFVLKLAPENKKAKRIANKMKKLRLEHEKELKKLVEYM